MLAGRMSAVTSQRHMPSTNAGILHRSSYCFCTLGGSGKACASNMNLHRTRQTIGAAASMWHVAGPPAHWWATVHFQHRGQDLAYLE